MTIIALYSAGLLTLLHPCLATSSVTYPEVLNQFHKPQSWIARYISASNKFFVNRISAQPVDPLRAILNVKADDNDISLMYGKEGVYEGSYKDGVEMFHPLQYDKSQISSMLIKAEPKTKEKSKWMIRTRFPGVFTIVAKKMVNNVSVDNVWKLYSMPTLTVEEGRFFNISLDFIEAHLTSKEGYIVIDDKLSAYLNVQWLPESHSVNIYGMPGVKELNHFNALAIRFQQKEDCKHEQDGCSQIKVNLNSLNWAEQSDVGPSFEISLSPSLSSVDDRISATKCIANLFGGYIEDLRGLLFIDKQSTSDSETSNGTAKIRGTILHSSNDCFILKDMARMEFPTKLSGCEWTILSVKHNLNYWTRRCKGFSLSGILDMGPYYPGSPNSEYIPQINHNGQSRVTVITLPSNIAIETTTDNSLNSEGSEAPSRDPDSESAFTESSQPTIGPTPAGGSTSLSNDIDSDGNKSGMMPSWENLRDASVSSRTEIAFLAGVITCIVVAALLAAQYYYRHGY